MCVAPSAAVLSGLPWAWEQRMFFKRLFATKSLEQLHREKCDALDRVRELEQQLKQYIK